MIVLYESVAADKMTKPVLCPKCAHGKIGTIAKSSKAAISRRGKPPPDRRGEGVQVKCPVCGRLWTLTIE